MVAQHYRWDFIGLSTDTKPTPATSEKVVNGSTFYCSDESKLYVYCDGTWYERKPLGGGGASYIAGTGIDISDDTISLDSASQASLAKADTAIQNTDYASNATGGVIKTSTNYGTNVDSNGSLRGTTKTYEDYGSMHDLGLISKVTLENVITGKGLVDQTALSGKQDTLTAGTGIDITNNVISATGGGGPTVVQTTGTSTTDVMSQKTTTGMVFADPSTRRKIQIGANTYTPSGVAGTVAIGSGSSVQQDGCVAIGASSGGSTAFTEKGMVHIGTSDTRYGYNSSNYRLLSGVHDGQGLHDAATVAQGNTLATSAPTTSTAGVLGQLYTDTTNMHTYQCTAISGDTYTWTQRW